MNILLTGASGNFGSELTRLAQAQTLAQSPITINAVGRADWAILDQKLQNADVIVHAASDLRTPANSNPSSLLDSNVMSTARLLEAAKHHSIKRWVLMSSCAVYGEDMRTDENSVCCPISINGISKHLCEKLVAEFCTANKIDYQIYRVFNSYGGNDQFSIFSKLKRAIQNGTPFTINNDGRMQRDFVHISDVASIVLHLLQAQASYKVLNIGTGVATKISSVVDMVRAQYPKLVIQKGNAHEAEYSRASIARLREFWSGDFIRVEDYIKDSFARYVAAPTA